MAPSTKLCSYVNSISLVQKPLYCASAAHPVGRSRLYVFDLSVRLCVRACVRAFPVEAFSDWLAVDC